MAKRDPEKIGYEWAAWYALQGDEPLERVAEAARHLELRLGDVGAGHCDEAEKSKVIAAAHLFMIAMAELLDPAGTSKFKATISGRKAGKPINQSARARKGHKAAAIVEKLVADGWKQEAAIERSKSETGLSRAEIFTWLSVDRRWIETAMKLSE